MPNIIPTYIPEGYEVDVVDVDPWAQRAIVLGKSVRLWWEQAVPCPCREIVTLGGRTGSTGEPNVDCAYCGGVGVQYTNGQQIVAALTHTAESAKIYDPYGPFAKGGAWLTLLPEHVGDTLDRYTLLDGARTHSELRRRKGTVDKLRYPVITRKFTSGAVDDRAVAVSREIGVQWCMAADDNGMTTGVELLPDVDFTVTAQGTIDWTLGDARGTAPSLYVAGRNHSRYSIRYWARPRFVLDDHTYLRRDLYTRDGGVVVMTPLPVRSFVILDFLGGSPPGGAENPQPTSDME